MDKESKKILKPCDSVWDLHFVFLSTQTDKQSVVATSVWMDSYKHVDSLHAKQTASDLSWFPGNPKLLLSRWWGRETPSALIGQIPINSPIKHTTHIHQAVRWQITRRAGCYERWLLTFSFVWILPSLRCFSCWRRPVDLPTRSKTLESSFFPNQP